MIHVSRSGATLGIFEEEKVREGLRTGEFIGTDLGWTEGMATWRPLSELETFRAAAVPPPQAATPSPAAQPVVPVSAPSATARTGLPWENRTSNNFLNALVDTITMIFTKPDHAFGIMKRDAGLVDPILYSVIIGTVCGVVNFLYNMVFHSFGMFTDHNNPFARLFAFGAGSIFFLICLPILVVIGIFIISAIVHVCLMIVGGAKQSFETTLRVMCYGGGTANVLQLVPFCGGWLTAIAGLVLEIIGLARAHETDTWRAVVAILLPMALCCGAILFFIFAVIGGAAASNWH